MVRRIGVVLLPVVAALVWAMTGCTISTSSGSGGGAPTAASATPAVTVTPGPATPSALSFAQACTEPLLTAAMKAEYDKDGTTAGGTVIAGIGIHACRNDYAHIFVDVRLSDGSQRRG